MTASRLEHRALCPDCGRLAVKEVINHARSTETITEATFECERGHVFLIKWGRSENVSAPDA